MKNYPISPKIREFWKSYPLRIPGYSVCDNCDEPTVLVQSMKGGYVTRNCPNCNRPETLPKRIFLEELELYVACPECKQRMEAEVLLDKNYGYVCFDCDVSIALFELLPRYEDL